MPMDPVALKAKMKTTIQAGLAKNFGDVSGTSGYGSISAAQWEKIADAVSGIAADIVTEITTNAEVLPGIAITPIVGPTIGTGQIV